MRTTFLLEKHKKAYYCLKMIRKCDDKIEQLNAHLVKLFDLPWYMCMIPYVVQVNIDEANKKLSKYKAIRIRLIQYYMTQYKGITSFEEDVLRAYYNQPVVDIKHTT